MMQLPGANDGKPDIGGAAKEAAKMTVYSFRKVGDLACDLSRPNVSRDGLPNNVKPGDAAGLPQGPTAKPPKVCNPHCCRQSLCATFSPHGTNVGSTTLVITPLLLLVVALVA